MLVKLCFDSKCDEIIHIMWWNVRIDFDDEYQMLLFDHICDEWLNFDYKCDETTHIIFWLVFDHTCDEHEIGVSSWNVLSHMWWTSNIAI